eukprot:CAMPEP_0201113096 /NCGR_PEP_ID=MMETSP0812-20130820/77643_1 /ASSEMBLY_ACC=CAM_ASM_000668 /TAXON_ID=98059 /ORGANISM="Dinobryon sp., Strain UTEXLB2267" /LENGTH=204 /DNA_ID=CAMNT_0047376567 /DNA_START=88 /DNA_END=701 /DNA_ORIENTATION=-
MEDETDYDFSSNTPAKGVPPCETAVNFYDFMEDPDLERNCPTTDEVGALDFFYILRDEFQKLVLHKFPNKTWPPSFISYNTPDKGVLPCETAANFYDFMEDPDLERDCPTIDEVGAWISFYISSQSKKSAMNSNNSHLYDMLCCFAYDSVSTTQKTTNSQELYLMTTTAFCDVFDHLFLRDEFQKLVLDKFPNKTWPPSFICLR